MALIKAVTAKRPSMTEATTGVAPTASDVARPLIVATMTVITGSTLVARASARDEAAPETTTTTTMMEWVVREAATRVVANEEVVVVVDLTTAGEAMVVDVADVAEVVAAMAASLITKTEATNSKCDDFYKHDVLPQRRISW